MILYYDLFDLFTLLDRLFVVVEFCRVDASQIGFSTASGCDCGVVLCSGRSLPLRSMTTNC